MTAQTLTARLLGDPDPQREARSEAIKARLPIKPRGIPCHTKKVGGGRTR